jgi:hypothetical protein
MKISDTTTPAVTIVLEGTEIADIQTICRDHHHYFADCDRAVAELAQNIMKSLEVDS